VDSISLQRLKLLHPTIRDSALDIYQNQICPALTGNYICRIIYTYRSMEEQAEIYARGRTKLFDSKGNRLGIVTKAKPGFSWHNYGLAIDFCLVSKGDVSWDITRDFDKDGKADWIEVADIFKRNGYEWGGDWARFRDFPHVQVKGYTIKELLAKETFVENGITYPKL
jgi:peptidoglycan L-alanyl-D-glutamate endopeptidase CwlK